MEHDLPVERVIVALAKGEQKGAAYTAVNPVALVPALADGDFVLTESTAILTYLADGCESRWYPKEARARARVLERMSWFTSTFYPDYAGLLVYPQVLPHYRRPNDEAQRATLDRGKERSERWLAVLDRSFIGNATYVCGNEITLADCLGDALMSAGDLVGVSFERFPNIARWRATVRALPHWASVNAGFNAFAESLRGKPFVTIV